MQFFNKNRLGGWLVLAVATVTFISCLKKIDEADQLDYNIYDREYAGDQWYVIESAEQVTNELGQIKARLLVVILESKVPELQPSAIRVVVNATDFDNQVVDFLKDPLLGYAKYLDLPYEDPPYDYCLNLAIYDEDNDEGINAFDDCASILE
ncbi:MAG: hypothetical protein ACPG21_01030 [Crocinitomicaceae bacterium]